MVNLVVAPLQKAASKARAKAEKKEEARREVRARREAVADVLLKHSRRPIQLAPPYRRRPVGLADMEQLFAWAESQGASIDNVAWGHDPWGGSGLFVKKRPVRATVHTGLVKDPWSEQNRTTQTIFLYRSLECSCVKGVLCVATRDVV